MKVIVGLGKWIFGGMRKCLTGVDSREMRKREIGDSKHRQLFQEVSL